MNGVACWEHFYTSFRPFDERILIFRPADGEELHLTHDEYLHLVLSVYKRYHKALTSGTTNSRMLECLRQVVQREIRDRERRANPTPHPSVNKSDPQCKRKARLKNLTDLGFRVEVLYRNKLVCIVRMVETGLHYALWGKRKKRLWRHNGAGSYYNRPEQIQEQLEHAVIATVFVVYAPVTLQPRFRFASSLPLSSC